MLVVERKVLILKLKEVYFCDEPFEVSNCDAVTFQHCQNKVDAEGFTGVKSFTSIIDLTQDLDVIWKNMDNKSTQYEIRRAEREGISIHINKHFEEFYSMNKALERKRRGTSFIGTSISLKTMHSYGTLFTAEYDGEVLGGHLYLENEAHIWLWLSASKRLEVDREKAALIGRANRLLHWEAIKYAKTKGIAEFDWGGLWSEDKAAKDPVKGNINSFKKSFGGVTVECYNYSKAYSETYRLAKYLYPLVKRGLK